MLTWTRSRANRRGVDHDLDRAWILQRILSGKCEVTGLPFDFRSREETGTRAIPPFSPSIDRIDSTKGYTADNCRMVVWIYNMAKSEYSDADVLRLALAIVATNEKENSE